MSRAGKGGKGGTKRVVATMDGEKKNAHTKIIAMTNRMDLVIPSKSDLNRDSLCRHKP